MQNINEKYREAINITAKDLDLPAPSFEIMECEIVAFDTEKKTILVKIPVLEMWLNPYKTMQGGIILGAIDNAVGPLSLLVAPTNVTRDIHSKLLKPIVMEMEYIYIFAKVLEHKKRRIIFEAEVRDEEKNLLATATLTNWVIHNEKSEEGM